MRFLTILVVLVGLSPAWSQAPVVPPPDIAPPPCGSSVQNVAPPVRILRPPRLVRFRVDAWSYYRGSRQIFVKRIDIYELGRHYHGYTNYYPYPWSWHWMSMVTRAHSLVQVTITWQDNRFLMRTYRMGTINKEVTVYSPYN